MMKRGRVAPAKGATRFIFTGRLFFHIYQKTNTQHNTFHIFDIYQGTMLDIRPIFVTQKSS